MWIFLSALLGPCKVIHEYMNDCCLLLNRFSGTLCSPYEALLNIYMLLVIPDWPLYFRHPVTGYILTDQSGTGTIPYD